MVRFRFAVVLGALATVGCDGDGVRYRGDVDNTNPPAGNTNSSGYLGICDRDLIDGSCVAYVGAGWTEDRAQANCVEGTLLIGSQCSLPNQVGLCMEAAGGAMELWTLYYDGIFYTMADDAALQTGCELRGGIWL